MAPDVIFCQCIQPGLISVDANHVVQTEISEYKFRIYTDPTFLSNLFSDVEFRDTRLIKASDRAASPDKNNDTILYE